MEVETKEGITVYLNQETGLKCFKTFKLADEFVACADGKSLFSSIAVYPHIVICELPNKNLDNDSTQIYRVYLRRFRMWLVNPEIESFLNTEDDRVALNFFGVLSVSEIYIHIACQSGGVENRVYVFKNKKWISIDYYDLVDTHLTSFDGVTESVVNNKPCLILEREREMNPYSVYFIEEGKWLSIPNPPGMKLGDCPIFRKVFNNYVVVTCGKNGIAIPTYFYVFAFAKNVYLPARDPWYKDESEEVLLRCWPEEYLAEKFVCYKFGEWRPPYEKNAEVLPLYIIYKTTDWQPHKVQDCNGKWYEHFLNPQVREDGKLHFEFPIEKSFGEIEL